MIGTIILIFAAAFVFMRLFNSFGSSKYSNDNTEPKMKPALNLDIPKELNKLTTTIQPINPELADDILEIKTVFENFVPEVFLKEAEQMFDKVFNAFVDSQHQTLKEMLSIKLYENFASQIQKREDKNLRQELVIEHKKTYLKKISPTIETIQLLVSFEVSQMVAMVDISGKSLDNPSKLSRNVRHDWLFETNKTEMNWTIIKTHSEELKSI